MIDSRFDFSKTDEFRSFCELSAELGTNPLLVQAAGGNTSYKDGGLLWVKASGTWLAEATSQPTMVPVDLGALKTAMAQGDPRAEKPQEFRADPSNPLRPSIETVVHASLAQRVVLHVHCVETIAWAVQEDAETKLQEPLSEFDWVFIPYRRPGLPLAQEIQARLQPDTNVLILGNHGLVVAGDSLSEAKDSLYAVHQALTRTRRPSRPANLSLLEELCVGTEYRLGRAESHGVATDSASLSQVQDGSLYPDHVIFLGSGLTVLPAEQSPAQFLAQTGEPPRALVVPQAGVLVHQQAPRGLDEMLAGLTEVAARLESTDALKKLALEDEAALLNWDAEKYRQELARKAAAA